MLSVYVRQDHPAARVSCNIPPFKAVVGQRSQTQPCMSLWAPVDTLGRSLWNLAGELLCLSFSELQNITWQGHSKWILFPGGNPSRST